MRALFLPLLAFAFLAPIPASHAVDAATAERIASALSERLAAAEAAGFSGSVLLAKGEDVVFERQVGRADPASGAPVTAATRFNLGSTGKLFTTVTVMQLVEQGRLDLDAPIGRYLPDWPVTAVREKVTARQLLLHTSGLGSYWGEAFTARRASLRTLDDHLPLLAIEPDFEPGSAVKYSNIGFMLLGLIVEAISGESYYDYVARHLFEPAGMRDSGYFAVDGLAEGVAVPHRGGNGDARDTPYPMPEPRGGAAGGGYSTPRDLWRFHRALTDGTLLKPETLDLLFAPVDLPAGAPPIPAGLGLLRYPAGGTVVYGHPGGAPGVNSDIRGQRDGGWVFIAMGNASAPPMMPLVNELLSLLAEAGGPTLSPQPVQRQPQPSR